MTAKPPPTNPMSKLALMRIGIDEAAASKNSELNRITELQRYLDNNPKHPDRANIEVEIATRKGKLAGHQQKLMSESAVHAQVVSNFPHPPKGFVLIDAPEQPLKLRDGERLDEAVGRLRNDEISYLQSEMKRASRAAPTPDETKAAAERFVAAQTKPRLVSTHDRFAVEFNGPRGPTSNPGSLALLAWLDPDALLARLHAEIDAQPAPELALTAAEKRDRLAKLEADLLTAEREEEALIERAAALGMHIERRRNANPMAVLGVMFAPEPDDKPAT